MRIDREVIAQTALRLLNDVGLDGLSMRLVAKELGVQAPALYWHVKNKQELLDAMANLLFLESTEGLAPPGPGVDWEEWLAERARHLRRTMLRYRDGARALAGTNVTDPVMFRTIELTLETLGKAGFTPRDAARAVPPVLHYTVGFTIEEQARRGEAYGAENPYDRERIAARGDAERFPLATGSLDDLFDPDVEAGFEHGLQIIITGIRHTQFGT